MTVAEAAKVVFQTALAGTLESKGFKRVSDTNYVIKGDGIEWRVVFGPEFKDDPGTFRDETGIFIPEIDELGLRAFPDEGLISSPLANTKYRAHYSTYIEVQYCDGERQKGIKNPSLVDKEPGYQPFESSYGRREHWTTQGQDLEKLGLRINGYWLDYVWPWLEGSMTKADACRWMDGTVHVVGRGSDFFGPWVGGHHQAVIDELKRRKAEALLSDDVIYKRLLQRTKERYPLFQWLFHKPTAEDVASSRKWKVEIAKTADHLAEVLHIDLQQ